jgi:hypothetical protein
VKVSEFRRAVDDEFGETHGRVLTHDLVLDDFDGRTAERAIADGESVSRVWLALCRANDVPRERWHGRGLASKDGPSRR